MAKARYGIGLDKLKKGLFGSGLDKLKAGYMYENGAYVKVWSGGTRVSYYDNETLLGAKDVDEGQDILHPSITIPSKADYTFVGWSTTTSLSGYVTELCATGESMTLYAMYVPNSLVVVQGGYVSGGPVYTILDTDYVSGDVYASGSRTPGSQGWGQWDISKTFTLNMRFYQNNSITVRESNMYYGWETDSPDCTGYFDGATVGKNASKTYTNIGNGNHTLRNAGRTSQEELRTSTQTGATYIQVLTLSNPIAWE